MTTITSEAKEVLEAEEHCLTEVLHSLHAQLEAAVRKLSHESRRARELTSQIVAATTDEEKQLLASDEAVSHAMSHRKVADIEALQKMLNRPYFARLVVVEELNGEQRQLEYKLGSYANIDCRIVDWRNAPISKLYYEYREGEEYSEEIQGHERNGKVILRNGVSIDGGELAKVSCRYGHFAKEGDSWRKIGDVVTSSGGRAHGALPPILSLITAEQFRAITEEADTAILIQGIAGSGKTTVALHRLAWLLLNNREEVKAKGCVIIVLNPVLKRYISATLPGIEVEGVRVLTLREWISENILPAVPHLHDESGGIRRPGSLTPRGVTRVLRSMAALAALESYQQQKTGVMLKRIKERLEGIELPAGIAKMIEDATSLEVAPTNILHRLKEGIARGLTSIQPTNRLYPGLVKAKKELEAVDTFKSVDEELIELFDRPELILQYDESKIITRQLVQDAQARLRECTIEKALDPSSDGLVMRLWQLEQGKDSTAAPGRGRYDHLVVDEVQELGPVELALILEGVKKPHNLTLVGDTAQRFDQTATFPGWEKLLSHWKNRDALPRFITLAVSHRSTLPIMRLADHVQKRSAVKEGRAGRVPIWFKCNTESRGVKSVLHWIGIAYERYPEALTAILACNREEARYVYSLLLPTFGNAIRFGDENSFSFEEGIVVSEIRHAKGLEFFNVLIWNPSQKSYPTNNFGKNMLYTAITRAEENLAIVTWNRPSYLLPSPSSKLLRLVDYCDEEEEE